jgi:uncharacterized membrane protein SirB2
MSLIPELELGLWNAWILVAFLFLIDIGLSSLIIRVFFTRHKSAGSSRQHMPQLNDQEKGLFYVSVVVLLATLIYSIFLPLKSGTGWFYAGLAVYLPGIIFGFVAMINFNTGSLDKPVTRRGLSHFKKPYVFQHVLDVHRHRHSLCFLGFSAIDNDIHNPV